LDRRSSTRHHRGSDVRRTRRSNGGEIGPCPEPFEPLGDVLPKPLGEAAPAEPVRRHEQRAQHQEAPADAEGLAIRGQRVPQAGEDRDRRDHDAGHQRGEDGQERNASKERGGRIQRRTAQSPAAKKKSIFKSMAALRDVQGACRPALAARRMP
jgi:hypothetical protein